MAKKAFLIIIIAVILGLIGAGVGVYFMTKAPSDKVNEGDKIVEEFDLKDGKRLTLEKVQIALMKTTSKATYLQADFVIVFKDEKSLKQAEAMTQDIKDAILGVFEKKTAAELEGNRNQMKEPVLNAIKDLYNNEEDKENVFAVIIPTFMVQQ